MPLGGRNEKDVLEALERNKRYMRGEIARRVNLKFAPEIRFRIDERFDEAERIEKLLRTPEVQRDLAGEEGRIMAAPNNMCDPHADEIDRAPRRQRRANGGGVPEKAEETRTSATCTAGSCSTSRSA